MKYNSSNNYFTLSIFLTFVIYLASNSFSCNNVHNDYCTNPDSLIAGEINKRKVVMIGESPHNNFLQYNSLINTIKYWVYNCNKNYDEESFLNLVLELDSSDAYRIEKYVKTSDDSAIKEIITNIPTLETLEFCDNLRKVNLIIDSMNQKRSNKIILKIIGFEQLLDDNYFRKNQEESESWFVNERDKNSSENLIRYIKNNPPYYRYLVFYGSAHLQKGYVSKNLGFSIPDEQTYGYYIANYLKEEFGSDNVVTIIQDGFNYENFKGTKFEKYKDRMIFMPFSEFPLNNPITDKYDYIIVRPYIKVISHPIGYIFSKFVAEKFSEYALHFGNLMPGYKAKGLYYNALSNLYFSTGKIFDSYEEFVKWHKSEKEINGFERLNSKEYEDLIYHVFAASDTNKNIKELLLSMGYANKDFRYFPAIDSLEFYNNWNETVQNAKFINAVGINWIGYPEEKVIAKNFLREYSGDDYAEPEKYLQWYRKNILNYNE